MKETLKKLDKIEFHDIGVESIKVISDPEILVVISFFLHIEELNDYQKNEIAFKGITKLEIGELLLDADSDIELTSFDYKYNKEFDCELIFLLGTGKPSFEMKIKCENIEMKVLSSK
ncbi:MAG: hypothetical protein ACI9XO_002272 [Paraglaciecola sp.]|jgi:hypothetical protein